MKKNNIFWISYSDLMTSLFFVMLILFVISAGYLMTLNPECAEELNYYKQKLKICEDSLSVTISEKKKLNEINMALMSIDTTYFIYSKEYKKHILKISDEKFGKNSDDMYDFSLRARAIFRDAGKALFAKMKTISQMYKDVQYVVIIEGQASKDDAQINDELSYRRAIALRNFWFKTSNELSIQKNIKTELPNCELIIAGSGQDGVPRDMPDVPPKNQRFLVTIIPKIGIFE